MHFEDLSPEMQEKAKACKSKEELAQLAEALGVKMSEEELDSIAGDIGGTPRVPREQGQ
jgi:hypothetical protein